MASRKPQRARPPRSKASTPRPKTGSSRSAAKDSSNLRAADQRLPIVGIGASAGGLQALQEFFSSVPPDPGVAFIVVQHLDPTRVSEMPALLSRRTKLKVMLAEDGLKVRANEVYAIPPDRYLTVESGIIRLTMPSEPRGLRHPIDALFYSLAQDAAERAVGVVLSGTGSDGSLGLRALKGHGGLAVVQDPRTAEYDGMPRGAIATGLADFILPPGKMLEAIVAFVSHDYVQRTTDQDLSRVPSHLNGILQLLHARRNMDFTGYKKGTLVRRISRRMSLRHLKNGTDYLKLLREDSDELNALFSDLLIQVTRFFREPEAWKELEKEVLARLVEEAGPETPIRVWVPGCATGEEAYSIAILLLELREKAKKNFRIQVFASDLDKPSLERARAGRFPDSIAADLSTQRLEKFFIRGEHRYIVGQQLRDTMVFAHQNLLVDPPFSRLDLISCRNVLIYLEGDMQSRVFDVFHFALKPGRFVFLGNSETVGSQTDLFQPLSKRSRIFRRLGTVRHDRLRLSLAGIQPGTLPLPSVVPPVSREQVALSRVREHVLERHTAACALVNQKFEILSLFGPTQDFLSQPSGTLTPDILSWVKEEVRTKLRVALQNAARTDTAVIVRGLRIRRGAVVVPATCTVEPLSIPPDTDGLLLVVFRDDPAGPAPEKGKRTGRGEVVAPLVKQLEYELKVARDDLQTSTEQLESSNEELRATNEEIMSMNEELQSANEELETSKEELQSLNEELTTVNSQLESKLIELQVLNDDINNLLTSTDLPAMFLDRGFQIRRFTPSMTRLFRLLPTDVGRPIEDIATLVDDPQLIPDAREVLHRLHPVERELSNSDGGFLRRVLPYRTDDDRIEGVAITYTDVSHRIIADRKVREALEFAETTIETLREPLLVLDERLVIKSANSAFYQAFRLDPAEVIGRRMLELGNGEWNIAEIRGMLADGPSSQKLVTNVEVRRNFAAVGERVVCLNARRFELGDQRVVLLALEDITDRVAAEQARSEALRQLVSYDEKERHRLALELHDETGQHVTAFLLGLATLKDAYSDQPANRALIEVLQERAEELAQNLHGISLQLRPMALDDHGLERALLNFTEDLSVRHQLEVDLQASGSNGRLPGHIETVLYRVTQEALTNVVRHAHATKVSVVLSRKKREVSLIIEDNGDGFDPDKALGDGDKARLGLRGMRERVMLAGGTLTLESSPGAGTTLFARIPLKEAGDGKPEA